MTFPDVVLMDLAGPCEVFSMANHLAVRSGQPEPYLIEFVSPGPATAMRCSNGLNLVPAIDYTSCNGYIDTLLVPGGCNVDAVAADAAFLAWLRGAAPRVRRMGSICTGAFVLAAAGLLDGRSATTHWEDCPRLAREYPRTYVCPDRIYVKDGNIYTSAGVTAGMDMALALVEEDLGKEAAIKVARALVMFVRRSASQSQRSALLEAQANNRQPLRELLAWAAEHPEEDLSVEKLAQRVNMSSRNFSRVFRRAVGKSPARFIEVLRVETARRLMEETDSRLEEIANTCGLGNGNSLRRSFLRVMGVSPSEYRDRFRLPGLPRENKPAALPAAVN